MIILRQKLRRTLDGKHGKEKKAKRRHFLEYFCGTQMHKFAYKKVQPTDYTLL